MESRLNWIFNKDTCSKQIGTSTSDFFVVMMLEVKLSLRNKQEQMINMIDQSSCNQVY